MWFWIYKRLFYKQKREIVYMKNDLALRRAPLSTRLHIWGPSFILSATEDVNFFKEIDDWGLNELKV